MMDLKQQHTTDEMVINDMKLVQTYNNDEENHKYSSKIPTATWLFFNTWDCSHFRVFFILFCFLFECNASKLEPILAFKQLV